MIYWVRWIEFGRQSLPVLLQAVNGPCPLIGISNVLFLRGKITLPPDTKQITFEDLSKMLKRYLEDKIQKACLQDEIKDEKKTAPPPNNVKPSIFQSLRRPSPSTTNPQTIKRTLTPKEKETKEAVIANHLKNFDDTVRLLPKLEHGLDINVIFSHPCRFEYTCEIAMFDLFDIRLIHGWIYDPQAKSTSVALGDMSYNEVVTLLATDEKDEQKEEKKGEEEFKDEKHTIVKKEEQEMNLTERKKLIRAWLEDSHGQLTVCGLLEMYQVVKESELCVHFHNNHFATLYKYKDALYTLVTDIELIQQAPQVVWMRLSDVQGDDLFLDQDFQLPRKDGGRRSRRPSNEYNGGGGSGGYEPPRGGAYGYNGQLPGQQEIYEHYAARGRRPDDDDECIIL